MARRLLYMLATLGLATLLTAALLFYNVRDTNWRAETVIWAQPRLEQVYVYGENAHFLLRPGFGEDVLLVKEHTRHYIRPADFINRGLYLPALESGRYRLYAGDLSIVAPANYELSGYTITRNGENLHYRFASEDGRLTLRVAVVNTLPQDVYDVIIDAGHGGSNLGAAARGWEEKQENLRSSLYLADLLRQAGLKVALTRSGDYVPGQPNVAADAIDPYVANGRVDLAYQTQAKYLISNHLNASTRAALRGWQLYRSVLADDTWQRWISLAFTAYGHTPNDDFPTLGTAGVYRRYSQDNAQTNADYYYILREVGGQMTNARRIAESRPQLDLRRGAEALLVEYLFLDNRADIEYWDENWQGLVEAVAQGCLQYWGINN